MIWYFLAGMIAGEVGVILVLRWWMLTHMTRITPEEFMDEVKKMEEGETHD